VGNKSDKVGHRDRVGQDLVRRRKKVRFCLTLPLLTLDTLIAVLVTIFKLRSLRANSISSM